MAELIVEYYHRVDTYRAGTGRCKHCGNLRFHVPTFFQATGQKMINARARQVPRAVKASRHPMGCMHLVTCRACAQKSGYTTLSYTILLEDLLGIKK